MESSDLDIIAISTVIFCSHLICIQPAKRMLKGSTPEILFEHLDHSVRGYLCYFITFINLMHFPIPLKSLGYYKELYIDDYSGLALILNIITTNPLIEDYPYLNN